MSTWRPPLWYDRLAGIAWRAVIVVAAVALLVSGLVALSAVILPAALGLLFACGLHPIAVRLRRVGLAPALSSALAVFLLIAVIAAVVWLTVRAVVDQWGEISALLVDGRATLVDTATDEGMNPSTAATIDDDLSSFVAGLAEMFFGGLVRLLPAVAGIATTVLLSFLVAFFFLKDGAVMWRWILARLGDSDALTDRIGRRVWTTLSGFIIGQTAIAVVDASLITLGAVVLGVPEPGAIFMLTFVGAYIPYIGAFLSGLLAILLALGDSGLDGGIAMLVVVLAVQVLEGNVLQPWIQGHAVRLHPLVIALAVTAGGALAGFLGVFLAVPVTAAGFVMLSELRQAGLVGPAPETSGEVGTGAVGGPWQTARGPIPAVRHWVARVAPRRRFLRADIVAGLPNAVSGVPDGMASGVLAGVSPVAGLYASFAGPIAGGLGTSTRLMVITTTSAAALAAGSGISGVDVDDRAGALALLTVVAGALMVVAGILRLGRYTRFVSHSVMLGFLSGVAVNIILGQLADLTGAPAEGSTSLAKAFDVLTHPSRIDVPTLLVGCGALLLLVVLARTRLAIVAALIALAVPTIVVIVAGLDSVARVEDSGAIPRGFPLPALPALDQLSVSLVAAAAAVTAIVLVQGAGVAESAPNDDGPSDANQDFVGQGAGNVASGFFQGMPVGGSVGSTALNVTAGGRSRWSAISAGLWMAVILVAFSGLVGAVAMTTLAAILIFAGVGSLRPHEVATILRTGPNSQIAVVSTFAATLLLPVAAAVGLGVVVSLLLQLNQEAIDLAVVELHVGENGRFVESPPPERLPSDAVTVLDVYGSLFYAGSRTLQARLPDPTGSQRPAVVLRFRGRTTLGATFFKVASGYAERLHDVGGRLYLTGLDPDLAARLRSAEHDPLTGAARLYEATPIVGASTAAAMDDAATWEIRTGPEAEAP